MSAKSGESTKHPLAIAFGARVNAIRRSRGITQKELARRAGYDAISLSRLVNGEILPKIDTAVAIARALDVNPGELFAADPATAEIRPMRPDRVLKRDAERVAILETLAEDFDLLLQVLEERAAAPAGQPTWIEAIEEKRKTARAGQS